MTETTTTSRALEFDKDVLSSYLVIGPYTWGRGYSRGEAVRNAHSPDEYDVYRIHPDPRRTSVGGIFGELSYKTEDGYAMVDNVRLPDSANPISVEPHVVPPDKGEGTANSNDHFDGVGKGGQDGK